MGIEAHACAHNRHCIALHYVYQCHHACHRKARHHNCILTTNAGGTEALQAVKFSTEDLRSLFIIPTIFNIFRARLQMLTSIRERCDLAVTGDKQLH